MFDLSFFIFFADLKVSSFATAVRSPAKFRLLHLQLTNYNPLICHISIVFPSPNYKEGVDLLQMADIKFWRLFCSEKKK